jgi:predicted deacylase
MKRVLSVGGVKAAAGEVGRGNLGAVELADGSKASVPVIVINGAEDGPILTVVAGVHGTELSGVGALLEVVRDVDPRSLRGALIAVPGANPLAYRVGQHITPIDNKNLSGPWYPPEGDLAEASITERMAAFITEALDEADYVIDMHANPLPSMPFVLTSLSMCASKEMAEEVSKMAAAYGVTVIDWPATKATTIRNICVVNGKPAITPELAGNIFLWSEITEVGTRGIKNVMKSLGMLDGAPEPQPCGVLDGEFTLYGWLYAQRGGLMKVLKAPGERIEKGDTVVELMNVYGDVVDTVTMPITGYCWAFTGGCGGIHAVSEGTKLAYVFADKRELGEGGGDSLSDM